METGLPISQADMSGAGVLDWIGCIRIGHLEQTVRWQLPLFFGTLEEDLPSLSTVVVDRTYRVFQDVQDPIAVLDRMKASGYHSAVSEVSTGYLFLRTKRMLSFSSSKIGAGITCLLVFVFLLVPFMFFRALGISAQEEEERTRIRTEYSSSSDWVALRDVNGDDRKDLLVQKENRVDAYLQTEEGRFVMTFTDPEHRLTAHIPRDVFIFDVSTRDSGAGDLFETSGLVGIGANGVYWLPFGPMSDGENSENGERDESENDANSGAIWREMETIFEGTRSGPAAQTDMIIESDSARPPGLVVPHFEGYQLIYFRERSDSNERSVKLPFSLFASARLFSDYLNYEIESQIHFPSIYEGVFLEENRREIMLMNQGHLLMYSLPGDAETEQSTVEPVRIRNENLESQEEEFFSYHLPPLVKDINGDDRSDLLLTDTGDGEFRIYHGNGKKEGYTEPQQILRFPGWIVSRMLTDITGNGQPDILVVRMDEVGLWGALDILSTYTVGLQVQVYKNKGDGTFEESPSFDITRTARLNIGTADMKVRADTPFFYNTGRNLIGTDGRMDLLVKSGKDQLDIFRGRSDRIFSEEPDRQVDMHNTEGFAQTRSIVKDINGDGQSDLVLISREFNGNQNVIQIFLSQK